MINGCGCPIGVDIVDLIVKMVSRVGKLSLSLLVTVGGGTMLKKDCCAGSGAKYCG